MHRFLATATLAAAAFLASVPADATVLKYTLSGADTASWTIDDSLSPDSFDADSFTYFADVTLNGTTDIFGLIFYDDALAGGVQIGSFGFLSQQLFSGSTSAPTLLQGTFSAVGFPNSDLQYTLTVSPELDSAVPEPSTWAMLLVGFGAIGFAMRRVRRSQFAVG